MPPVTHYRPNDYPSLILFLETTFTGMGREFLPDQKDSDIRDINTVYLSNRGSFFVLEVDGQIRGCVGVRRFSDDVAELKRLYLDPAYRGTGIGFALCAAAIGAARELGYNALRLDTTLQSEAALGLFKKLGFRVIERYNDDPFAEVFMELSL